MLTSVDTVSESETCDGSAAPVLVLRLKKKTQARIPLDAPCVTLGRATDSDIVLDDSSGVSRNHAHILVVDDEVVVEDLSSRNGTFVNGKLTTRRTLRPGDRIAIGHYRLHYLREARRDTQLREPESDVTRLLRLWGPAAVTAEASGCPLCHTLVDPADGESSPMSETGEHIRLDVDVSDWVDEPPGCTAQPGDDPDSAGAAPAGDFAEEDFPKLDVVEGATDDFQEEDEDEIMARVERLVGLAPTSTASAPAKSPEPEIAAAETESSPPSAHNARAKIQSRKPKRKESKSRRRKPSRRSRLHC